MLDRTFTTSFIIKLHKKIHKNTHTHTHTCRHSLTAHVFIFVFMINLQRFIHLFICGFLRNGWWWWWYFLKDIFRDPSVAFWKKDDGDDPSLETFLPCVSFLLLSRKGIIKILASKTPEPLLICDYSEGWQWWIFRKDSWCFAIHIYTFLKKV